MKPESVGPLKPGSSQRKAGAKGRVPVRIPQIPMEWMDPMSWRLPSGKALAEFAFESGFLAPLMLGTPKLKKRKAPVAPAGVLEKSAKEAPGVTGTFRAGRN